MNEIKIENFKGITSFEITSGGRSFELIGSNGAGKSSVMEAIVLLLGGRMADVKQLLRDPKIPTTLDLITDTGVSIKVTVANGKRRIEAEENGQPVDASRIIDQLFSENQLDPARLLTCPRREQLERFAALGGIDIKDDLAKRRQLLDNLAEARSEEKAAEKMVDLLGAGESIPELPPEPEKKTVYDRHIQALERQKECLKQLEEAQQAAVHVQEMNKQIAELKERLRVAEGNLVVWNHRANQVAELAMQAEKARNEANLAEKEAKQYDESVKAYQNEKKAVSDAISRNEQREKVRQQLIDAIGKREDAFNAAQEHYAALLAKTLPTNGRWDYDEDKGLTYDGREIGLLSTGEAMAAAVNYIGSVTKQKMKTIFVANASLLSADKRQEISALAQEKGMQIVWEVVGSQKKLTANIIEEDTK